MYCWNPDKVSSCSKDELEIQNDFLEVKVMPIPKEEIGNGNTAG
jgi:hypothetical protein